MTRSAEGREPGASRSPLTGRFGFALSQRGTLFGATTYPELLELASAVDGNELFDSLWVGDSLLSKPRPDSLTLLSALSQVTERVVLGTACMASFPVREPITFAYQWATLDQLARGRMLLAACTGLVQRGASAAEGAYWGVTDRERPLRLEENIHICRELWESGAASVQGDFRSFEAVDLEPKPVQKPCPIWIASNPNPTPEGPRVWHRALRRVARLADGWMSCELFPGMLETNWNQLGEFLREEGREPRFFPNTVLTNVNVAESREAALEETKRFLDAYYGPVFLPIMVEKWTAGGTPSDCIKRFEELRDAGAKHLILRVTSWDQSGQYRRIVDELLAGCTNGGSRGWWTSV